MSFYDDARNKVRQNKIDKKRAIQQAETTKRGYERKVDQRSKKQEDARQHG